MAATLPASMAENARRLNMISSRNFLLQRSNARIGRSAIAKWRRLNLLDLHRVAMDKARKTRHGSAAKARGKRWI